MNKKFIFTLIALTVAGCGTSTSSKKAIESPQLQEPIAETTPVSRIVPEVTPLLIPTLQAVPELDPTNKSVAQLTKPLPTETLQAVPTANPVAESAQKAANSAQKIEQAAKSTNNSDKPVSIDKLVANINSKIGCGKVNENYKIKVATIAIANYNPQSLQGLSRKQIRQAVKQSIADYPERAEGLVAEYRSQNCTVAQNPTAATSNQVIPSPQLNSCKQLKAQGIKDINVTTNPWAKRFDRDNDGIACESK
ncbi:putative calcium-binding protein [Rivularia sp. PCC 7116]|uniref:excalibur calcium-binding domain-containing protein n=1 Tax=Rivularia sp. PCC 7116 TaxID=373994 RepID=UPI00029ECD77|nr:excalibur calcium-binding domain-containing protein [Rivularia sp. PCC 7116]AFY52928.1 putative calcium-binding protein [Rivularia sp. PCC 7116]